MWITNGEKRNRDLDDAGASLRNDNDLYILLVKYAHLENSPIFGFPKIWNNFDETLIKLVHSKLEFNHKFKKFFLEQLTDNYVCNRLLCPHCHLQYNLSPRSQPPLVGVCLPSCTAIGPPVPVSPV